MWILLLPGSSGELPIRRIAASCASDNSGMSEKSIRESAIDRCQINLPRPRHSTVIKEHLLEEGWVLQRFTYPGEMLWSKADFASQPFGEPHEQP